MVWHFGTSSFGWWAPTASTPTLWRLWWSR